ncbi:hypothetical protein E4U31_007847 [Claviceps sp. LM219 group G6]|nr:hypothetical protein E4U15_006372 [Claviceps sp. LM218 group G6]KAG6101525.1 hypothetical protein E4U14_006835 [Claviceps sp. LM454 group G7]KAG6108240.1 hypothetical protein E4U31_007847 [Claviceps sp. LM219 group G6]
MIYPQSLTGDFSAETWGKPTVNGQSIKITPWSAEGYTAVEGLNGEGTSLIRMVDSSGDLALQSANLRALHVQAQRGRPTYSGDRLVKQVL